MKTFITLIFSLLIFISCENQQKQKTNNLPTDITNPVDGKIYGEAISNENIISAEKLPLALKNNDEKELKLIGKIDAVCQGSGCWVDIDMGNGETVHVTFKDEAFVLPKDVAGQTATIEGIAVTEVVSVEMQKRMAKEEGLTQTEIDKITEPLTEYYFEAVGVTLKNSDL